MTTSESAILPTLVKNLINKGKIDLQTAQESIKNAIDVDTPIASYLVQRRIISQEELAMACSEVFGLSITDLDSINITDEVRQMLSLDQARKLQLLPLFHYGKSIHVAVADPHFLNNLDDIKFATGFVAEPIIVEYNKLQTVFRNNSLEGSETAERIGMTVSSSTAEKDLAISTYQIESDIEEEEESEDDTGIDITKFVDELLIHAVLKSVSDIHVEPYEKLLRVRYRIDGILQVVATPPKQITRKLIARIKVMSRLNTSERRVPQDGRIHFKLNNDRFIDLRVNTLPTLYGEKVVMRLLDASHALIGMEKLGFDKVQHKVLLDALNKPDGMILVTGPTGSGKTVTLYSGLNILNTSERNISTAEDPCEIQLLGVNQVNVNPKVGLTFASALKAFLRQDPDIIMVGEIRDIETSDIAIKAAQTGHLVLSTLHTNSAPETLTRLVNMGVKPFNIASTVHLIIAQRLARKLCSHCKSITEPGHTILQTLGFAEEEFDDLKIYEAIGCSECSDGYKGRVGIYQVMPISPLMGRMVMDGKNALDIAQQAKAEGIADLRESALQKVREGVTSLNELERITKD
ncbi:MAG: type IV-A pilus assembly ATPase PilB [Thiotrichaceae bacterium]|nr:type IV-A pilus assembly ATPase PilB [Thiotrichaceae bacterium]